MFSIEENESLSAVISKWRVFQHSEDELEDELEGIRNRVKDLYYRFDLQEPIVVFCRGQIQQTLFPALVELMVESGQEESRTLKFERHVLEDDALRAQWLALWKECYSSIDWARARAGPDDRNFSLTKKIRADIDGLLLPQLMKAERGVIDDENLRRISRRIDSELNAFTQRFRAAVASSEPEQQSLWRSFLARLPVQFKDRLGGILARKETVLSFRWNGIIPNCWLGVANYSWLAAHEFMMTQHPGIFSEEVMSHFVTYSNLFKSATEFLFCEHCCFVFLKPLQYSADQAGRAHHESSAAIKFVDGTKHFLWHGVEVPENIILHPEKIKVRDIERAENTEVQRVMIERFGLERFLEKSLAKTVHKDSFGTLYRTEIEGAETLYAVQVTNATPEPDGTYKIYFIRVPPHMKTAREAVAWTFGLNEFEYSPQQES